MRIGYARTSTTDQQAGFEAQVRDLEAIGCEKIYQEQVSSVGTRDELAVALDFVRIGSADRQGCQQGQRDQHGKRQDQAEATPGKSQ